MAYFDCFEGLAAGWHLVWRKKLVGSARHYGVIFVDELGLVRLVWEFNTKGPQQLESFADFELGHHVTFEDFLPASLSGGAQRRLDQVYEHRWSYHWTDQNCETVARWVVLGKHESKQVQNLGKLALVVAAAAWLWADD